MEDIVTQIVYVAAYRQWARTKLSQQKLLKFQLHTLIRTAVPRYGYFDNPTRALIAAA